MYIKLIQEVQYEKYKSISSGTPTLLFTDGQYPIEPDVEEFKFYAPGFGLIKDDA